MTRTTATFASIVAALTLVGCGHRMHQDHAGMHHGAMNPNAAATAPAKVTASTAVLSSGYKKVESPATAKLYFVNRATAPR